MSSLPDENDVLPHSRVLCIGSPADAFHSISHAKFRSRNFRTSRQVRFVFPQYITDCAKRELLLDPEPYMFYCRGRSPSPRSPPTKNQEVRAVVELATLRLSKKQKLTVEMEQALAEEMHRAADEIRERLEELREAPAGVDNHLDDIIGDTEAILHVHRSSSQLADLVEDEENNQDNQGVPCVQEPQALNGLQMKEIVTPQATPLSPLDAARMARRRYQGIMSGHRNISASSGRPVRSSQVFRDFRSNPQAGITDEGLKLLSVMKDAIPLVVDEDGSSVSEHPPARVSSGPAPVVRSTILCKKGTSVALIPRRGPKVGSSFYATATHRHRYMVGEGPTPRDALPKTSDEQL